MKQKLLKTMLLLCALIVGSGSAWATDPTTLYLENFGSTSSTSAFSSYTGYSASTSMFTTSGDVKTHYSGSGSVGKNNYSAVNLSSGYTGASGLSGCYHGGTANTEATIIQISDINIEGYESLSLSFGALGGATTHKVNVSYIIDDGDETDLITDGSITNTSWTLLSEDISGTGSSLTLIFKHKPTKAWIIRMDDIKVTGTPVASSDPSSAVTFTNTTPSLDLKDALTYSQVPTTAAGYSGTISYEMTANTAGATINASTGELTLTQEGSVTVKATAAAVPGSFSSSNASYTLTVSDNRASAGLAWSNASAAVTYGSDSNVFPSLTNTHSVAVTYSSSNTSAATINATTGVITLKDVTASTTIKATFAGDATYKPQEVSYTLNVSKAPFEVKDGVFDFVSAASQEPLEDYGSGMTLVSSGYTTANATWKAGNVTMVTSRASGNGYRWWSDDGTLRFYNGSKATFSVPSGNYITRIVTTGANFNSADVGTLSGSTWTGVSNEVALSVDGTRNIKTITVTYVSENQAITISTYGYATFACSAPLDFTGKEIKAYYATANGRTGVTFHQINKVPANTGILLYKDGGATENIPVFDGTGAADVTDNVFKVGTGATIASVNGEGETAKHNYILNDVGGVLGFYKAAGQTVATNKAYIQINYATVAALVKGFIALPDFEETAVEAVKADAENGVIFNLAGQRVSKLQRGINIINGKKVVVK